MFITFLISLNIYLKKARGEREIDVLFHSNDFYMINFAKKTQFYKERASFYHTFTTHNKNDEIANQI